MTVCQLTSKMNDNNYSQNHSILVKMKERALRVMLSNGMWEKKLNKYHFIYFSTDHSFAKSMHV